MSGGRRLQQGIATRFGFYRPTTKARTKTMTTTAAVAAVRCYCRKTSRSLGLFTSALLHLLLSSFSNSWSSHAFLHPQLPGVLSLRLRRERPRHPSRLRAVENFSDVTTSRVFGHRWNGAAGGDGGQSGGTNGSGAGPDQPLLSITTFNVLAPIFKRVGSGRESEFRDTYLERHTAILEHLKVR